MAAAASLPPPPSVAPKKGPNAALLAVAAVLVLAVLGGGGWFAWSRLAPGKGATPRPGRHRPSPGSSRPPRPRSRRRPKPGRSRRPAAPGEAFGSAPRTGDAGRAGGRPGRERAPDGAGRGDGCGAHGAAGQQRPRPNPGGSAMSRRGTTAPAVTQPEPARPDAGELTLPRREALVDGGSWSLDTQVERAYAPLDTTRTKGRLTREALAEAGGAAREITSSRDDPEARFIDLYTRAGSAFANGDNATAWQQLDLAFEVDTRGRGRRAGPPLREDGAGKGTEPGAGRELDPRPRLRRRPRRPRRGARRGGRAGPAEQDGPLRASPPGRGDEGQPDGGVAAGPGLLGGDQGGLRAPRPEIGRETEAGATGFPSRPPSRCERAEARVSS